MKFDCTAEKAAAVAASAAKKAAAMQARAAQHAADRVTRDHSLDDVLLDLRDLALVPQQVRAAERRDLRQPRFG